MDDVRERFQNLHEIVAAARAKLNRNIWDYLIGGAETETSLARNRAALDSIAFRHRDQRSALEPGGARRGAQEAQPERRVVRAKCEGGCARGGDACRGFGPRAEFRIARRFWVRSRSF